MLGHADDTRRAGPLLGHDHAHDRQVREAEARLAEVRESITVVQGRVEEGRRSVARLEAEVTECRAALEQAGHRRVELELRARRSRDEADRAGSRAEVLDAELQTLQDEAVALREQLADVSEAVQAAEEKHGGIEHRLERMAGEADALDEELRKLGEAVSSMRAELAAQRQRQESVEQQQARLVDAAGELAARAEGLGEEARTARARIEESTELLRATEAELAERVRERAGCATRLRRDEDDIAALRQALSGKEGELREARLSLERTRERVHEFEMACSRAEADRAHLDVMCVGEIQVSAAEAVVLAREAGANLDEVDLEALENEVADIRSRIDRIGPVRRARQEMVHLLEASRTYEG